MSNPRVELFKKAEILTSDAEHIFTVPKPDPEFLREVQGGCSDGKQYYYQSFMHRDRESCEENNTARIAKIDFTTGEVVKWSEAFRTLNHCNDMAYNSKRNTIAVCHNNPNKYRITLIDPDTLTIIDSFDIGVKMYSIDYNAKQDLYVVGLSGGQNLMFLDADFHPVDGVAHLATDKTARYTTQGICSDDELIYCVLFDGKGLRAGCMQNVITVYDWKGNYVGIIEFDVGRIEPENISVINGEIYVCSGCKGARFDRISPKLKNG